MGDREPSLSGTCRTDAEHERIAPQGPDIGVLSGGARPDLPFAQADFLEACSLRRRVELEQRTLGDSEPDRALDVAGSEVLTTLELVIEPLQDVTRLFAAVPGPGHRNMIAALFRHDPEPAFDQCKVLSVLSEQR